MFDWAVSKTTTTTSETSFLAQGRPIQQPDTDDCKSTRHPVTPSAPGVGELVQFPGGFYSSQERANGDVRIEDLSSEVRSLRTVLETMQRRNERDSRAIVAELRKVAQPGSAGADNSYANNADISHHIEDAFTKQRMIEQSRTRSQSQQLSDFSIQVFEVLEQRMQDIRINLESAVRLAVREEFDHALKSKLNHGLHHDEIHVKLRDTMEAALLDHHKRLQESITRSLSVSYMRLPSARSKKLNVESSMEAPGTRPFPKQEHPQVDEDEGKLLSAPSAHVPGQRSDQGPRPIGRLSQQTDPSSRSLTGSADTKFARATRVMSWITRTNARDYDAEASGGPIRLSLMKIVHNRCWRMIMAIVIMSNLFWTSYVSSNGVFDLLQQHHVSIAWEFQGTPVAVVERTTNITATVSDTAHIQQADTLEIILLSVLCTEVLFRILISPTMYFCREHWNYNLLDAIVCLVTAVDMIACTIAGYSTSRSLPNLTILRVFGMIRSVLDQHDYHVFQFSRTLYKSVISSIGLVWCVLIMLLLLFICVAMLLNHGVQTFLGGSEVGSLADEELIPLAESFGTIPISILSLTMAITDGNDWSVSLRPLRNLPAIYTIIYCIFIAFSTFGILNVVMGIFVECAYQVTQDNKVEKIRRQIRQRDQWENEMKDIFAKADQDGSGTLSWEEFREHITHPVINAYFQSLDLDPKEAGGLFTLLDVKGNGQIKVGDFVKGCAQLKGEAKSIDLATLRYEFMRFHYRFKEFSTKTNSQLQEIVEIFDEGDAAPGAVSNGTRTTSSGDLEPCEQQTEV